MKTAISLPDRVFRDAERHARRTGKSRSQLYADAVAEYLARHGSDSVTEMMNEACAKAGPEEGHFTQAAARRLLRKEKW
jgi:metal-responsive CopG/Arc/MetJ family transcriptional regulator